MGDGAQDMISVFLASATAFGHPTNQNKSVSTVCSMDDCQSDPSRLFFNTQQIVKVQMKFYERKRTKRKTKQIDKNGKKGTHFTDLRNGPWSSTLLLDDIGRSWAVCKSIIFHVHTFPRV